MGSIILYPWLPLNREYIFDKFQLLPYVRGKSPAGEGSDIQEQLDNITTPYLLSPGEPIQKAAVMRIGSGSLIRDLVEDDIEAAFEFTEILAVSGLSKRSFFRWDYWNKDNFKVIIQRFTDQEFISYESRRKDGSTTQGWPLESYQVLKPEHIHVKWCPNIDEDLLNSLLNARALDEWVDYWGGILYYNLSNTDNNEFDERLEVVLAIGAFESLLSTRGDGKALARKFEETMKPKTDLPINECQQLEGVLRFKKSATVRNIWARDLYNLRSKLAHVELGHKYPAVWSTRNHLLLASYVFPLVLKCLLEKKGAYQFDGDDFLRINSFEKLVCQDHFGLVKNRGNPISHPWNQILQDVGREDAIMRAIETLQKMRDDRGDKGI